MAVRSGVNPSGFVGASGKPERVQPFHGDTTGLRVEVPHRFPGKQKLREVGDGSGDGHVLPLECRGHQHVAVGGFALGSVKRLAYPRLGGVNSLDSGSRRFAQWALPGSGR